MYPSARFLIPQSSLSESYWVLDSILLIQAPPGYVFLLLLVTPIVYCLPISLCTAEMATALPDAGMVDWIQDACGSILGSHTTYWIWITYIFDAAIYPVLAGEYVAQQVDFSWMPGGGNELGKDIFVIVLISIVTIIKVVGMDVFVKFSTVLAVISLMPIAIYLGFGFPRISLDGVDDFSGDFNCNTTFITPNVTFTRCDHEDVDWSTLIPWVLWLYSGFFSLGAIAGDVDRPKRTFSIVIAMLLPLVTLLNTVPLAIALSEDPVLSNYDPGHFNNIAGNMAGSWLSYMFIVAAAICLVGLYSAQVLVAEESTSCFVHSAFPEIFSVDSSIARSNRVMRWLLDGSKGNAPLWIIFNGFCSMGLAFLPYTLLVEFTMLIHVPPTLLFLYAYLYYKVKFPNLPRPFNIPGGVPMAAFLITGPTAATLLNLYYAVTDAAPSLGIAYLQAYCLAIVVGVGIIIHLGYIVSGSAVYSYRNRPVSYADMFRYEPPPVNASVKGGDAYESIF